MRIFGACKRSRQHCAKRDAERDYVVIGHPLAEIEKRSTHSGLEIRRLQHRFWFPLQWAHIAQANAHSDLSAVSERDYDTRPDYDRVREASFDCVCEILEQREGQRYFGETWTVRHFGMPDSDSRPALAGHRVRAPPTA
jgi:hypothetical protein